MQEWERFLSDQSRESKEQQDGLRGDLENAKKQVAQIEGQLQEARAVSSHNVQQLESEVARLKEQLRTMKATRKEEHAAFAKEVDLTICESKARECSLSLNRRL